MQDIKSDSPPKILRMTEVVDRTGFSRSWIYVLIKLDAFPQPRKIGKRSIGFDAKEVNAWINAKLNDDDHFSA